MTDKSDAQASAVPLHDELHWMGQLYGFPIMCRAAERIAALESAREVQDAALAVARNDFRELALRAEKLEREVEALRALLIRAMPLLDDYLDYANSAPIWHATGGIAQDLVTLISDIKAINEGRT